MKKTPIQRLEEINKYLHYQLIVKCTNCDYSGSVSILRNTLVESHQCPNCGCKSLIKNNKY